MEYCRADASSPGGVPRTGRAPRVEFRPHRPGGPGDQGLRTHRNRRRAGRGGLGQRRLDRDLHPAPAGRRRAGLPAHRHPRPLRRADGLFRDRGPGHGPRSDLPDRHPARRRGLGGRRRGARPRHLRRRQQRLRVHGQLAGHPAGRALGGQRPHPGHHLGRQLAFGGRDGRRRLDRRGRHPVRDGPFRPRSDRLGLQRDPLRPPEPRAEPLDPGPLRVVPDRRDRRHHRARPDRGGHEELRLHPLRAGGAAGGAAGHHRGRTRPALRAVEQHRDRLLVQPRLRHRRGRRRAGEPDPLRAVLPGEAPLLPRGHGELPHPHRAVLLAPDRGHAVGRQGQRQGRQVAGQRVGQPDRQRVRRGRGRRALFRVSPEPRGRRRFERRGDRREPHLRGDERGLGGAGRDPLLLGLPRHDLTGRPVLRRPRRGGVDVLLPALLRLPRPATCTCATPTSGRTSART